MKKFLSEKIGEVVTGPGCVQPRYDLLVFIGRFQPLHKGHQEVIERARKLAKQVLVLVGSANAPRSVRNPFTYEERAKLITDIYPDVITRPLQDHTYNDSAWIFEVQSHARGLLLNGQKGFKPLGTADFKIGLIGCNKDHTSYYLKMFPDWGSESVEHINPLNATAIRNDFLEGGLPPRWFEAAILDLKTYDFLEEFQKTSDFVKLQNEYFYLEDYKERYGEGPHLTADTLVQVGGKILVIRRGKEYGHGLLAMPGGFVNFRTETFENAAFRELKEETRLKVPLPVLKGSVKATFLADAPHRSDRGRLVSHVYHVKLENDVSLPEVRGSDDADEAFWMDIAALRREDFFEDHYHIIKKLLGIS